MEKEVVQSKANALEAQLQSYMNFKSKLEEDFESLSTNYESQQLILQQTQDKLALLIKGEQLMSELEMKTKNQGKRIRELETTNRELQQQLKESVQKNTQLYDLIYQYENDQSKGLITQNSVNLGDKKKNQNEQDVEILIDENKNLQELINQLRGQIQKYDEEFEQKDINISRLEYDNLQLRNQFESFENRRNSVIPSTNFNQRPSYIPQRQERISVFPQMDFQERQSKINFTLENQDIISQQDRISFSFNPRATNISQNQNISDASEIQDWKASQIDNWENVSQQSEIKLNINWDSWAKTIIQDVEDDEIVRESTKNGTFFESQGQKNQVYQKYLKFDETELLKNDYLNLRDNQKMKNLINKNPNENLLELRTFSDNIFRINQKGVRERLIIFMTTSNIYLLKPNLQEIGTILISSIDKVTFSNSSVNLMALHTQDQIDFLLETFRRVQMNTFLIQCFKEHQLTPYKMEFNDSFYISFKKKGKKSNVDLTKQSVQNEYQGLYKDSIKQGFLQMYNKVFLQKSWKEFFLVLTNVGILVFKEAGSSESKLIPINKDANLIMDPLDMVKLKNVLKINYTNSDHEFFFAAQSKQEQEDWYESIHQVIINSLNQTLKGQKEKSELNTYANSQIHRETIEYVPD